MESKNSSIISALNYLRTNKPSLEEMRELYGSEGAFAFHTFQARYSGVRKLKDGRTSKEKREQVIDELIDDLNKKKIRNPIKDAKRQELINYIQLNKQYETTKDLEHDDAHGNGTASDGGMWK